MKRRSLWILPVFLFAAGCHRQGHGAATVPPPAALVAPPETIPAPLMDAESAFARGEYLLAAVSYETYFLSSPKSNDMDRNWFHYGVSQSLSGITAMEAASNETFRQLILDYPESSFVPPARMALAYQDDIARLQAEKVSREDRIRQLTALVPPPPPVLPLALVEAESAFDAGDFTTAAKAYETYLQAKPQTEDMDRILLRLGVAQSMSGVTAREAAGNDTFKKLIRDFPNSPYALSAQRVLALRENILRLQQADLNAKNDMIKKLNDELDNIKKVDSGRRRTP